MAKSGKATVGTRSGEIINIPIENISIRLNDGSVYGPKLYTGEDGKKHIEEGYFPLDYNEEQLRIIQTKAWNRRRETLLKNIDSLKSSIKSVGRVLDPIDIVLDSTYLLLVEGHRRHMCCRWLQLEQFPIAVIPAMVYTAGYGDQGNFENLEYQQWFRNQKESLSIFEKYTFIQDKLASGLTKEEFCLKVGIDTNEFDTIMLIAGQSSEVRSLIEDGLISPTTIKIAKATAERKEWTQKQFEDFIQDSVKLADQLGKKKVTGSLIQSYIEEYQPTETNLIILNPPSTIVDNSINSTSTNSNGVVSIIDNKEISSITTSNIESNSNERIKIPKLKIKPTAKEIEEIFIEIMLNSSEGIEEEGEVVVYFPKRFWDKALDYFNRIPERSVERVTNPK